MMNAQSIITLLDKIKCSRWAARISMPPEISSQLDAIFRLARNVEPCDRYRNGADREFWIWTDRGSYAEYVYTFKDHFTYYVWEQSDDCVSGKIAAWKFDYEEARRKWPIYFPDKTVWFKLYLAEHNENRAVLLNRVCLIDTKKDILANVDLKEVLTWILNAVGRCVEMIRNNQYNSFIADQLPYRHRSGVVPMGTYWKYVPEDKERLFGKADPLELEEFLAWDPGEDPGWTGMTVDDYLNICDCLYDLLNLKVDYPVCRKNSSREPLTPLDYYQAYSAYYSSVKAFLNLDSHSKEAFFEFISRGTADPHTWDVCLVPSIHLCPQIINGKIFLSMIFDHKFTQYDLLIHLTLEFRKRGIPIVKPKVIEDMLSGELLFEITPYGDHFDWRYAEASGIKITDNRRLPLTSCEELVREIRWFPTKKWFPADGIQT